MNRLKSWLRAWLGETPVSDSDRFYDNYIHLIASGARLKMVEAMFNLNVFPLFANSNLVLEDDLIAHFNLHPVRAKKWLHLLACEGFLIQVKSNKRTAYKLPVGFIKLIQSHKWKPARFFFSTWGVGADENLTDVLKHGTPKTSVSWPPKTDAEVEWLEGWMTDSAGQVVDCLLDGIDFSKVRRVLDVGGGDGSVACALVRAYPHLEAAVYNLPKSAEIARRRIGEMDLSDKVKVIDGDFINEAQLPKGHDLILFNRVFFDWDEAVNRKLLLMAYRALPDGGTVGICEFYKEDKNDLCVACEYRYIFHDDFAPHVMKSAAQYHQMLRDTGFSEIRTHENNIVPRVPAKLISARKQRS